MANRRSRAAKKDTSFTFEFEEKNFVVNGPNSKGVLIQDMRSWEDTIIFIPDGRIIHLHIWEIMVPYMRPVVDRLEKYDVSQDISELAIACDGFIAESVK